MRVVLAAAALLLASAAAAQPAIPALTGRVIDQADILSPSTEEALTKTLAVHEDSTSNQIAVLTIPSLDGAVLERFATDVFRAWGLGTAEDNNGVLILVARDDRKIRIEVGYGLEGDLPDATAASIIRNEMTPRFRNGDFDAGVIGAVDAVIGSIEGSYVPAAGSGSGGSGLDDFEPILLVFLFSHGLLPMFIGFKSLYGGVVQRYFVLLFTMAFVGAASFLFGGAFPEPFGTILKWLLLVGYPVGFILRDLWLSISPEGKEKRAHYKRKQEAFKKARKAGRKTVVVDGTTYSVPTASSSSGGGSSFSGGGGSSGGGGASGGW